MKLQEHELVPKHEVLSEKEKKEVLRILNIKPEQLPKIRVDDPIAKEIGAKVGDIVRIVRKSPTAGVVVAYRYVVPPILVKVKEEKEEE